MIELLGKLGIPSLAALVIAVCAAILWKYVEHRLEMQRRQFESELELIRFLHAERFAAVDSVAHLLAELQHNLCQYAARPEETAFRAEAIRKYVALLRSLAREKSLVLGNTIIRRSYELTEYAKAVASGESRFDLGKYLGLERELTKACHAVLSTIPRLEDELERAQTLKGTLDPGARSDRQEPT